MKDLHRSVSSVATALRRKRVAAYVSRVAWLDLERYVRSCHRECASQPSADELGCLYISSNSEHSPFNPDRFAPWSKINQVQVHAGWRLLDVSRAIQDANGNVRAELLGEQGASLWYSQGATGEVMVFIAPFKSEAMKINEENLIIGKYQSAADISLSAVRKHFVKFLKYCSLSSVHGNLGFWGYAYRTWLKYNDIRYKSQMLGSILQNSFLLALGGVAATFYTSSKWPW